MPKKPRRSLGKREFDAAVKRLSISDRCAEMARRALVAGDPQSKIAEENQVTVAAVSHQVGRVWQAHVEAQEIPEGFERISAVLPREKAEIVRTWANATDTTRRTK